MLWHWVGFVPVLQTPLRWVPLDLDPYTAGTVFGRFFATELGERNANKTCTLKGVTCTVCYCTGLIENWLNFFVVALAAYDDDVELNVLGCRVDTVGTNCDQCVCMVQCCFTSTGTIRLIRTGSPGRPPRLSHSSSLNPGCPCVRGSPL